MTQSFKRAVRGVAPGLLAALVVSLAGCNGFFVKETSGGGGTGTGGTGNYVYASNSTSGSTFISGYTLAKGTLTAATGAPYPIGNTPTAMVASSENGFLYVASAPTPTSPLAGIFAFSIGTGGALSVLNGGNAYFAQTSVVAMDVSADGKWLVIASGNDVNTGPTIAAYPLNATSGAIGTATPVGYTITGASVPIISAMKVAPSGDFISIALGLPGFITFQFNSTTGLISGGTQLSFPSSPSPVGAYDVAIDSNNFLYVAATGSVNVFTVSATGAPTQTAVSTETTAEGGPFSLALDGTSYLYASAAVNSNSPTLIYGFSIKSGVLAPLSTATITAPALTTKMGVDGTGAYLVAQGYDSSAGLKLYSIGTASNAGVLTSLDTAPTGSTQTILTALALTH